ncbi:hypothetical protein [Nitratifractor sp.]
MGHKALVYKQKVIANLQESYRHLERLEGALEALEKIYAFPLSVDDFASLVEETQSLAYSDQAIYRFSKLQDCMGAKLFKSVLLYQGENVNKPFLDILNRLESMNIVEVDEWFEIRDLRNEIAHDYDTNDETARNLLNTIHKIKSELKHILDEIGKIVVDREPN